MTAFGIGLFLLVLSLRIFDTIRDSAIVFCEKQGVGMIISDQET
jgi:hypothetical protein